VEGSVGAAVEAQEAAQADGEGRGRQDAVHAVAGGGATRELGVPCELAGAGVGGGSSA